MDNKLIKVLLIEDNPGDARLIREMLLETVGALFELEWLDRLETGLQRLSGGDIDLILLDLGLPDSQGLDSLTRIGVQAPHLPVLVLTGLADGEVGVQAVAKGAQDYLIKGQVDGKLLVRAMRYAIERKRMQEELSRHRDHLAELVTERTAELEEANEQLRREITERKQAEEQTKELREYLQLQIDRMPIALITWDTGFRVQTWNPSAEKIFGFTVEEALGKHPYDLIVPKEAQPHVDNIWRRLIKGNTTAHSVNENTTKDGQTIICDWTNTPLRKTDGTVMGVLSMVQDITDHEQAEAALQESEERYRDLFDNANDLLQSVKPDGHFLYINNKWQEVLGYCEEEVANLTLWDIIHPDSLPHCRQAFQRVMSGEAVSKIEAVFVAKDGRLVNVEGTSSCRFEDGKPVATRGIFRDITERKQAEEALQKSEERYRDLFDNANDLVQSIAPDGRLLYVNKAWQNVLGYSEEETHNLNIWDIIHPDSKNHCMNIFQKVMSGEAASNIEAIFVTKDGRSIFVEGNAHCKFEDGKPASTQGIFRDVNERKLAEGALRQSEEKYSTLVEKGNDGVIVIQNGVMKFANSKMTEITGFSLEEAVGKPFIDFVSQEYRKLVADRYEKRMAGEIVPERYEIALLSKNGSKVFVEINASRIEFEGEAADMAIVRDITQRKKMEEQLMVTDRLASVGELASGIAHELNNPLTGVIGFADLLMGREDLPDDVKEDLEVINSEAKRAAQVARSLLAFARKHPEEKKPVNINTIIQGVLQLRAYEQRLQNIEVNTSLAPDLPEVMANDFQLQQVFLNIVINAEYFMTEAHGRGTLTITTERIDNKVRASFADDGPGISRENLIHLFDPFFTTKEVGKGTGLGLSIAYGVVTEHGGRMYAESEPGKGATFIIELPLPGTRRGGKKSERS